MKKATLIVETPITPIRSTTPKLQTLVKSLPLKKRLKIFTKRFTEFSEYFASLPEITTFLSDEKINYIYTQYDDMYNDVIRQKQKIRMTLRRTRHNEQDIANLNKWLFKMMMNSSKLREALYELRELHGKVITLEKDA